MQDERESRERDGCSRGVGEGTEGRCSCWGSLRGAGEAGGKEVILPREVWQKTPLLYCTVSGSAGRIGGPAQQCIGPGCFGLGLFGSTYRYLWQRFCGSDLLYP